VQYPKLNTSGEPLAIFGGTFDPVHYGHLRCAEEARQKLGLKRLLLLPAGKPPHRGPPQATTEQRLAMLRLALEEFPYLELDDRETHRSGPSYMVETLAEFRRESPDRPLLLLLGQDAANLLHTWFDWRQLFSLAHIVILTRPGSVVDYNDLLSAELDHRLTGEMSLIKSSSAGKVIQIEVGLVDVSATDIKHILSRGRSPVSMLPPMVLEYIREHRLYF
jgi:nicotinate-nucleotide adenylyltransferase